MDSCPECGIQYDMEFDYDEAFEYRWVPRCDCFEDDKLHDDHIWENSERRSYILSRTCPDPDPPPGFPVIFRRLWNGILLINRTKS